MILFNIYERTKYWVNDKFPDRNISYNYNPCVGYLIEIACLLAAVIGIIILGILFLLSQFELYIIATLIKLRVFVILDIPHKESRDAEQWCKTNCKYCIINETNVIFFKKSDAVLYKLTWLVN